MSSDTLSRKEYTVYDICNGLIPDILHIYKDKKLIPTDHNVYDDYNCDKVRSDDYLTLLLFAHYLVGQGWFFIKGKKDNEVYSQSFILKKFKVNLMHASLQLCKTRAMIQNGVKHYYQA